MSKKVFNLVTACIGGVQTIAIGIVTYCDAGSAVVVNSAIALAATAAIEICHLFVKEEEK